MFKEAVFRLPRSSFVPHPFPGTRRLLHPESKFSINRDLLFVPFNSRQRTPRDAVPSRPQRQILDQKPASQTSRDAKAMQKRKNQAEIFNAGAPLKRKKVESDQLQGSHEEILDFEVGTLLKAAQKTNGHSLRHDSSGYEGMLVENKIAEGEEIELEIVEQSSTGDGLAYSPLRRIVYVVPFSVPGDRVLAKAPPKPDKHPNYMVLDYVKLLRPSTKREGVTPRCAYFTICSGCQFQMIPYADQLEHKKTIVEKAFKYFSNLPPESIPTIGDTIGSPLQYSYRTKLTPHYDGPPGFRRKGKRFMTDIPKIGYTPKNNSKVVDIEHCPIGTDILNEGLKIEREKVHKKYQSLSSGATILLRESTERTYLPDTKTPGPTDMLATSSEGFNPETSNIPPPPAEPLSTTQNSNPAGPSITYTYPTHTDVKTYTSDHRAITTEHISSFSFTTFANSFFQNNNSVLPIFLSYVREHCLPKESATSSAPRIKYLLDAYCGSGLFAVSLSELFTSTLGIDIDAHGIRAARLNAERNHVANAGFIAADASALFADVPFPPDQSLCVIDPPRKGASEDFLRQLCDFGAKRVVYVSCNVHTQARDCGMLVRGFGGRWKYEMEALRGFDFFPQTGHVEGLCFLNRVANVDGSPGETVDKDTAAGGE